MDTNKKRFGNINILDLRSATEESVGTIESVGNINIILHSRETAGLVGRIHAGNINRAVETNDKSPVLTRHGQMVISKDYFKGQSEPVFLCVMGQLVIEPDVPAKDIQDKLSALILMGQLLCPDNLAGVVGSKTLTLLGHSSSYEPFSHNVLGELTLDETYLKGLEDGASLSVLGEVSALKVLDNDLIKQKIAKLSVLGEIVCHEENASVIQSRMPRQAEHMEIIPAGFEMVEHPLTLDANLIELLPAKNLYCKERLVITADVTASMLDSSIEKIVCKQMIVCPVGIKTVLAKKANLLETKIVFYEGPLWLVEDHLDLKTPRLAAMKEPSTLVVTGEVEIDPGVPADLLSAKLLKVHNLGRISATPEQLAVVEGRLGTREGEMEDSTEVNEIEAPGGISTGNVDFLVL